MSAQNFATALSLHLVFTDGNYNNFNLNFLNNLLSNSLNNKKNDECKNNLTLINDTYYADLFKKSKALIESNEINDVIIKKEVDTLLSEVILNMTIAIHNYNNPKDIKKFFFYNTYISLYIFPFINSLCTEEVVSTKILKENLNNNNVFLNHKDLFENTLNKIIEEVYNNHNDDYFMNSLKKFNEQKKEVPKINNPEKNKSCFVATLVYEDIDHPNVEFLRNFRDEKLSKYYLGKLFIKFYYKYSPYFVEKIKPYKIIQKKIRLILDKFISYLK